MGARRGVSVRVLREPLPRGEAERGGGRGPGLTGFSGRGRRARWGGHAGHQRGTGLGGAGGGAEGGGIADGVTRAPGRRGIGARPPHPHRRGGHRGSAADGRQWRPTGEADAGRDRAGGVNLRGVGLSRPPRGGGSRLGVRQGIAPCSGGGRYRYRSTGGPGSWAGVPGRGGLCWAVSRGGAFVFLWWGGVFVVRPERALWKRASYGAGNRPGPRAVLAQLGQRGRAAGGVLGATRRGGTGGGTSRLHGRGGHTPVWGA
uniref:Uncharacterized protein n=1 Tax=Knipowitschia caucasica TaxID=637954 RepID=A0AAV2JXH7_KNICA